MDDKRVVLSSSFLARSLRPVVSTDYETPLSDFFRRRTINFPIV